MPKIRGEKEITKGKTIEQFAAAQEPPVSYTTVRKWIAQRRIEAERDVHGVWHIFSKKRPERQPKGALGEAALNWKK